MAVITIRAGASYDVATRDEVRAEIEADRRLAQQQERERARGVKVDGQLLLPFSLTDAATTVFLGDTGGAPDQGFLWNLKLISVQLTAADTVKAFLGSSKSETTRLISTFGTSAANQIATFSSSQVILKPGQGVVLVTAAHAPTLVFLSFAQAPAEMAYKVFD